MAKYKVLTGIDYPPNKRAEIGDIVDDLDGKAIKWLLEAGYIEALSTKAATPAPADEPVVEFNPDAKDRDGDGIVQEGTEHERPIESETI